MATRFLVRHIQDHNEANTTEQHHWGYADRVVPCTKDAGTCAYLDAVYWMHDTSMLYTAYLWGVLLVIAITWSFIRVWRMDGSRHRLGSVLDCVCDSLNRARRRWLLQGTPWRWLFGTVSRLQVVVLACLLAYLLVFSLVGIVYKTWVTPVKGTSLHNTRSGLGGFADRAGALAYALTPFTVLLSNRESVLSLVTGIPYQHFNFLHRWCGRIIFVQAFLHTLGWTVVEGRLYQPQPTEYARLMSEQYIIFGVVAMFLLTLMIVLSTRWAIDRFGYEVFKAGHWILAILYLGACWGHWDKLWCWMVASLALVVLDQSLRMLRTLYLHFNDRKCDGLAFRCADAQIQVIGSPDDLVVRLDFDHVHSAWQPGQHFHICFPGLSIWQSHPFTPASLPDPNSKVQHHTYLLRVRKGVTARLAALGDGAYVPAVLTGPYGSAFPSYEAQHVLAVAGGSGVTFTLPIVLEALRQQTQLTKWVIDFVWIVRKAQDMHWLEQEIKDLKNMAIDNIALQIKIFITRDLAPDLRLSSEKIGSGLGSNGINDDAPFFQDMSGFGHGRCSIRFLGGRHPTVSEIVDDFVDRASNIGGNIEIVGSGPDLMGLDLRKAVASIKYRDGVHCYWDSRE